MKPVHISFFAGSLSNGGFDDGDFHCGNRGCPGAFPLALCPHLRFFGIELANGECRDCD
jgi:hypothetical protein